MSKSQNTKFYSENEIQPQDKNTQTENLSHLRVTKQRKVIENQGDQTNQQVQYDQHSPQQKQKLLDVMLKIQLHKNKKRAKKLVNNLPSRMLKSFDEKKFHFLNDKSYIYDQVFFQQSLQNNQLSSAQEDKLLNSDNQNEVETISQPTIKQNLKNIQQKRQSELILNFNKDEIVEQGRFQLLYSSTQKQFNKLLYLLKKSSKVLYQTIQRLINYIPIIQPSNIFKLFWDIFNMLNIIICIFLLPIKIIFDFNFTQILSIQLLHIIPICLILDVIININTGYFKKGQVIKQRYKIFMHFIKKRFFSDIISIFPLILDMFEDIVCIYKSSDSAFQQDHFSHQSFFKIIQLMFFLKIFTFSYNLRKMEERFNLSNTLINILQLTKLFFTLILINHFFACIWIFVARVQIQNGNSQTWMSYDNIYLSSWKSQYIASFYFMTVTMITVGYGDILPKNDIEMTLSISTMIFASGVFGYCLNQVGVIFNNFFYIDNQIKKKLLEIQKYMSKKNINSNLQLQIREYLEYYWREQSEICQEQEQETIQKLSESLRSKLLFEANKIVLQDSPIFKQNFSKPVIEQTVPLIHQIKYTPENDILVRGIQDDQSIYFIENGSVEVILDAKQKNSQRIYTLKKGQSFGEYTFFTGLPRIENIRSREFTTVLKISRQDFLNLISRYPEDVENFSNIRDQIAYLDDYTKINLKCLSCHSFNHHINDCLYLHYIPKKARIIKTYNDLINSQNLQRQKYERRQNNKDYYFKNSKIINLEVVKQVQMYLELNESILDAQDEMNYSQGYFDIDKLENIDDKNLNNFNEEVCKVQKYIDNDGNSQNYLITKNGVSKFGSPTIKGNVEDLNSQITSSIQINENLSDNQANNEFTRLNSFKANIMNYFDNKAEFQKQYSLKNNQENSLNSSQKLERINSLQNNQYNGYDNFQYNSSELSNQQIRRISQIDDSQELFKNNQKQTPSSFLSLFKLKKNNTINSFNEPNDCPEKNQQFVKSLVQNPNDGLKSKRVKQNKQNKEKQYDHVELLQIFQGFFAQMKKNDRSEYYLINQSVHTDMQSEICLGFDKMKQFVKYNPRFNFSSVISRFNHLQDQRRRLLYKKGNRSSKIRQTVQLRNSVFKNSDSQFNLDLRKSSKNATALAYQNTVLQNLDGESFSSKYVNGNTNFAQIFDIDSSGLKDSNQRVSEKDLTQLDQITINLNQINAMSENISVLNSKYSPQKDSMYQPSDLNNSQNYEIIEESKLSCIPYSFKKRKSNFQHNLNEFN